MHYHNKQLCDKNLLMYDKKIDDLLNESFFHIICSGIIVSLYNRYFFRNMHIYKKRRYEIKFDFFNLHALHIHYVYQHAYQLSDLLNLTHRKIGFPNLGLIGFANLESVRHLYRGSRTHN